MSESIQKKKGFDRGGTLKALQSARAMMITDQCDRPLKVDANMLTTSHVSCLPAE